VGSGDFTQNVPERSSYICGPSLQISKDNEFLHHQFEYSRSRLRIARASSLNFAITTVFGSDIREYQVSRRSRFTAIGRLYCRMWKPAYLLAIVTWNKLVKSYFGLIRANYALKQNPEQVEKVKSQK